MIDGLTACTTIQAPPKNVIKIFKKRGWKWIWQCKHDGTRNSTWKAKKQGLTFKIEPMGKGETRLSINGSWHSFALNGQSNINNIGDQACMDAVDAFVALTNIPAESWAVNAIEYGVNFQEGVKPSKYYNDIICSGKNIATPMTGTKHRGDQTIGMRVRTGGVGTKIYNKSAQEHYKQKNTRLYKEHTSDITRMEVQANRKVAVRRWGIHTIADFKNPATYQILQKSLLHHFENLTYIPHLSPQELHRAKESKQLSLIQVLEYAGLRDKSMDKWLDVDVKQRRLQKAFAKRVCTKLGKASVQQGTQDLLTKALIENNNHSIEVVSQLLIEAKQRRIKSKELYNALRAHKAYKDQVRKDRQEANKYTPEQPKSAQLSQAEYVIRTHISISRLDLHPDPVNDPKQQDWIAHFQT